MNKKELPFKDKTDLIINNLGIMAGFSFTESAKKYIRESIDQLINSVKRECVDAINKLPLFTEIKIQPLDIDDEGKTKGRVYWLKHKALERSCYDNSLEQAVEDFLSIVKESKLF